MKRDANKCKRSKTVLLSQKPKVKNIKQEEFNETLELKNFQNIEEFNESLEIKTSGKLKNLPWDDSDIEITENASILIVDDDKSIRRTMSMILEKKGNLIETAKTGDEAIKKAQERFFNIAILEIKLPDIEGVELIKPLKKTNPDIEIIVATGYAPQETAVKALNAGAAYYVTKPINMDEMLLTINRILEKQKLKINNRRLLKEVQKELDERKKTEEKIKSEKDKLKSLFNGLTSAEIGIDIVGIDYKVYYQNQLLREKFGDLTGELCYEKYMGLKEPCDFCPMIKAVKNNRVESVELKAIDGRYYNLLSAPLPNPDGTVDKVIEVVKDVNERKNAEEKILIERNKLKTMFESLEDVVYKISEDFKIEYMNPSAIKEFGDRVGEYCYKVLHNKKTKCVHCDFKETLKGKIIKKDRKTIDSNKFYNTLITPLKNSDGTISRLGIDRNITEKKKTEKELINSKQFLRNVFDGIQNGISVLDNDLNIIQTNKMLEKMYSKEMPLIGKKCYEAYQKRDSVCPWCPSIKAIEKGVTKTEIVPYPSEDNPVGWIELSSFPLKDANGNVTGVIESVKDITEGKKAEKKIKVERNKLKIMFESLEDVVYTISEDFKIQYMNSSAIKEFGDRKGEFCYEIFHNRKSKCPHCDIDETLKGKIIKRDWKPINSNKIYNALITPLKNSDGTISRLEMDRDITLQKTAEKELKEAVEIINKSPAVVFLWKNEEGWPVEYVSNNVIELFGYSARDFLSGKVSFAKIVHPDDLERVRNEVATYSNQKRRIRYAHEPYRIISKDGKIKWIDDRTFIRRDENGNITHYQGIVLDITHRKKAEESLRKSEERFRDVAESTGEWIWEIDENGLYTYVSPFVEKILGYKPEDIVGKMHFYDFFAPEVREELKKGAFEVIAKKESFYKFINQNTHKKGKKVILETNGVPILIENGNLLGYRGSDTDITERKRKENEIIILKEYNEEILHSVKSGIVVTDKELNILSWNDYMEESYGIKKEKILNNNLVDNIPLFTKKKFNKILNIILKNGKTFKEYMVKFNTKKGIKFYNLTIVPRKKDNKIIGILMSWDDVTELAEMGNKLTTIYELTKKMMLSKNENEIYKLGLDAIEKVLKFHNCTIVLKHKYKNELVIKAHRGYSKNLSKVRFPLSLDTGIINLSYKKSKLINIPDIKKEPKYVMYDPKIKSEIAVPLTVREKPIGVINVESYKLNAFNESDEKLLTTLTSEISTALSNIKLFNQTKRRALELASVNQIGQAISSSLKLNEIFRILHKQLNTILDAKNFYIALYDKKKNEINFGLYIEDDLKKDRRKRKLRKGMTDYVIKTKKPLLIKSNFQKACMELKIKPYGKDAKSWLGVPLISKGDVIGVITIQDYENENAYDKYNLNIILTIADQTAIAIEKSKLYEQLKENYENLKEIDKIQNEFLTVTSHEFGTPITILKGNVDMFLTGVLGDITDLQRKRMLSIKQSIERLIKLRKQTILISKMDSGELYLKKEKILLNKLIDDFVKQIKIIGAKRGQQIITNLKECEVYCDKEKMKEVFENLLSNAIKYSGDETKIEVNLKEEKNNVHIIVSDNGSGIGKKHLNKIFNRFYIAHGFLHHKEGVGLGLSIVKEIVEAHDGNIYCDSEINKGTKFHIFLPKK